MVFNVVVVEAGVVAVEAVVKLGLVVEIDVEGATNVVFMEVFEAEWSDLISSPALRSLNDCKLQKEVTLPLTEDLKVLSNYLDKTINIISINLRKNVTMKSWLSLSKTVLVKLITFNKRRGGEAARMTLDNWVKKPNWGAHANQDILSSLNTFEKKLATEMDLLKINGKKGRHVPVLITPGLKEAMTLLVNTRNQAGIDKNNNYFFANSRSEYIRPWAALKELAKDSG